MGRKHLRQPNEALDILTGGIKGVKTHFNDGGNASVSTVKSSEGFVSMIEASNPATADAFLQVFDTSDSITVGSTTPNQSYLIPGGNGTNRGAFDREFTPPMRFANAIKYACTTAATGSSAPASSIVINMNYN